MICCEMLEKNLEEKNESDHLLPAKYCIFRMASLRRSATRSVCFVLRLWSLSGPDCSRQCS